MVTVGRSKRDREWEAFRCVYDEGEFESVVPTEKPDFSVTRRGNGTFGVEITELFQSESNARAACLVNYIPSLLNGGRPRHKDDYTALEVKKVSIQHQDGTPKAEDIPAIICALPTIGEYRRMLLEVIADKQTKFDSYDKSLSHTNLIVRDHIGLLMRNGREDFSKLIFDMQMRNAISKSRFREVFLVTHLDGSEVYIPLVLLALLNEFELLIATFKRMEESGLPQPKVDLLAFFAHFLNARGYAATLATEGETETFLGNTGLMFDEAKGIVLRDHADFPLPPSSDPQPLCAEDARLLNTTLCVYGQVVEDVVFVTPLARNIVSGKDRSRPLTT